MDSFSIRDVVYLNSGSPPMMVRRINKKIDITELCVIWIDDFGVVQEAYFNSKMVHK